MSICPKTGLACQCVNGECKEGQEGKGGKEGKEGKGGREISEPSSPPSPSSLPTSPTPNYRALAKIQPEEVYRPEPLDFSFERAVQGLVSLYAIAYGGEPVGEVRRRGVEETGRQCERLHFSNDDLTFWTKVDAICQVGEKLEAGEDVSVHQLPSITREEAKRMFHLVMEAQIATLPPHLLPENQFKCTGCGG